MKIRLTAAALCLLALPVLAQDKPKEPAKTPAEPNKQLARMAGDWTFTNKMWMDPSQPPAEWTGTMRGETVLGGRYVQTTWTGNLMGMPFEALGTEGYDNTRQYVSSWVDNTGAGISLATGTCDDSGNKCSLKRDMINPMTGKKSSVRSELTWVDDNTFKNEMYGPGPDGKEFKWMEILVKRK